METKISLDECSRRILSEHQLIEMVLNQKDIDGAYVDDPAVAKDFNEKNRQYFDLPIELRVPEKIDPAEYHQKCVDTWFLPDKYMDIDVLEYLNSKVATQTGQLRIKLEYEQFKQRGLINVLRTMIYLVDVFRENNIVWGVGRGSSVSSYVLYVIGINKINPLEYGLSSDEFFK
jgi:DNA polymerase III alpha subunit